MVVHAVGSRGRAGRAQPAQAPGPGGGREPAGPRLPHAISRPWLRQAARRLVRVVRPRARSPCRAVPSHAMMDAAGYARPRPAPLTVAAAQPACAPADVRSNALEHARVIRQAAARVVVFPELSLTGYELGAQAVSPDDPELAVIAEACSETGAIALAGAPVAGDAGTLHIAMLLLSSGGAQVAYRKSFLGGAEPRHYVPGGGPVRLDIDGWRVGLGICKDTGV